MAPSPLRPCPTRTADTSWPSSRAVTISWSTRTSRPPRTFDTRIWPRTGSPSRSDKPRLRRERDGADLVEPELHVIERDAGDRPRAVPERRGPGPDVDHLPPPRRGRTRRLDGRRGIVFRDPGDGELLGLPERHLGRDGERRPAILSIHVLRDRDGFHRRVGSPLRPQR